MAFDIAGAKKAGYSDAEIADHLAKESNFDIAGARKSGYSDAEILDHLSADNKPAAQPSAPVKAEDVPVFNGQTDVPLTPDMAGYQQQQQFMQQPAQPEPSLFDKNLAVAKGVGVLAGNAVPSLLGAIGGSAYGVTQRMQGLDGSEEMARGAQAFSPLSTEDPLAQRYMEKIGNALGAFDPGYAALAGVAERANIKPAVQRATPRIENTYNDLSGRTANRKIADRILAGETTKDLAPYMVPEKSKPLTTEQAGDINPESVLTQKDRPPIPVAVKDSASKEAVRQGYDQGFVQSIKQKNPETQRAALEMTNISETGKNDMDYRFNNRPSDVVGRALMKQVRYAQKVNSDAGKSLDEVAAKLTGEKIDYEKPLNEFKGAIEKLGVQIGENNELNFDSSSIRFSAGDKRLIKNIYSAANSTDGSDAFKAHELKRLIDTTVDYGKNPRGTGVTDAGEKAVKKFRKSIDAELDNTFDEYNKVNTKYSDSIDALNDIQDASGPRIDLNGVDAASALGTRLSALLSKQQGRIALKNAIEKVNKVATKYGGEFKEDIPALIGVANELDRVHGSHAETSFLGETEKGTATGIKNASRDLSNMTVLGALATGGAKAIDYVRRVTPESQYKSLRELLKRNSAKEESQ